MVIKRGWLVVAVVSVLLAIVATPVYMRTVVDARAGSSSAQAATRQAEVSCGSGWRDVPGSLGTYRDTVEKESSLEALSVELQTSCKGSRARMRVTIQSASDQGYHGQLGLAVCVAHGLGSLAYCNWVLTVTTRTLSLPQGASVTLYGPVVDLLANDWNWGPGGIGACNLDYGVPIASVTTDPQLWRWSWDSLGACIPVPKAR